MMQITAMKIKCIILKNARFGFSNDFFVRRIIYQYKVVFIKLYLRFSGKCDMRM